MSESYLELQSYQELYAYFWPFREIRKIFYYYQYLFVNIELQLTAESSGTWRWLNESNDEESEEEQQQQLMKCITETAVNTRQRSNHDFTFVTPSQVTPPSNIH